MKLHLIEKFLQQDISPSELADELREMIYNIIFLYGEAPEGTLCNSTLASMVYRLKELEDLMRKI